jgi:hypothetical protein
VKWRFHISPGSFSVFDFATSPGSISVFSVSVCQRFNLNAHQEGKAKANN